MRLNFSLFTIFGILLFGCDNISNTNKDSAFFGGEIVNPKGDNVILYNRKLNFSDTIPLDKNNRFSHKINNVKPGYYSFRHGGEFQLLILEPQDSILIRLNTYDFDESLVFTGDGAKKNNYLIKTFLNNERESQQLVKYSETKEPEAFSNFVDNRLQREIEDFERFKTKNNISDFADAIISTNINYHNYADKEIYPFAYFGKNKMVHIKDLPEDFYNFRKNVNYNANELSSVYAYSRFLFSHFDNLAVTEFYKNKEYHSAFDRHELSYNKAKLELVDSLVDDEEIKNSLLKFKTRDFINNSNIEPEINEIMASYLSKTTNEKDIKAMNGLIASLDNLKPGKGLPDLRVINAKDNEFTIAQVVNKPTLIYFWSSNMKKHYKNSHYRVKELQQNFPNMGFMSINIDDNSDSYWKSTINQYKFNLKNEYRFQNSKEALETLAISYLYKVIIVDSKANIMHPNVNIFNKDFETTLGDMLQKKELVSR